MNITMDSENEELKVSNNLSSDTQAKQKRNKGNSLFQLANNYIAIDIETTGLDPSFNSIIEVAAIKIVDNQIVDTFTSLIQPDDYYIFPQNMIGDLDPSEYISIDVDGKTKYVQYVDDFITNLTGITNEMLKDAPTFLEIANSFYSFIADSILVGHNVNFDINFLYDNLIQKGHVLSNDFIDTMRLSRRVHTDLDSHSLTSVINKIGYNNSEHHRALADAESAHAILQSIRIELDKRDLSIESLKPKPSHILAKSITAQTNEFDDMHPLYQKECVFTGTLESYKRSDAMQLVVNCGGTCRDNITKTTNYLVLGNNDYRVISSNKSNKYRKAEALKLKGYDISIISEDVFQDLINQH